MSPAGHDEVRAAAALLAIAAHHGHPDAPRLRAVVLGSADDSGVHLVGHDADPARLVWSKADPDPDRSAAIAAVLADWLAQVLRDSGADPREFARQVVAESIAAEATEAAEGTP